MYLIILSIFNIYNFSQLITLYSVGQKCFRKHSRNVFMLFWEHYERPDNDERSVTGRILRQSSEDIPWYLEYEFLVTLSCNCFLVK